MKKIITLSSAFIAAMLILSFSVTGQSQKKVLIEDYTGVGCQYCPDGTVQMNNLLATYPGLIYFSAVHNNTFGFDAMTNAYSLAIQNAFPTNSLPRGMVDRVDWPGQSWVPVVPGLWGNRAVTLLQGTSPVSVSLSSTYNPGTRQSDVTVTANFTGPASGDMKINLYFVEDNIAGIGFGYNQINGFNNTPGHFYYQAGNPIQGFIHNNVMRYAAGPVHGVTGIIPASVSAGSSYSTSFSYTIPVSYNASNMKIIGVVIGDDNTIMNVEQDDVTTAVGINENIDLSIGNLYPNPANNFVTVEYNLKSSSNVELLIYNALGQVVQTLKNDNETAGNHKETFDLKFAGGMYFLNISTDNATFTRKLNIVTSE